MGRRLAGDVARVEFGEGGVEGNGIKGHGGFDPLVVANLHQMKKRDFRPSGVVVRRESR